MALSDDIKERLDIVDVVSGSVPLQKAGRSFKARCPFHEERTPSFFVFPERQTWRCFGACATGGDVFSFVMRAENLDFGEALRLLAQRAGVPLRPQAGPRPEQTNPLYQANEEAARFFQETLAGQQGAAARAYLQKRRVGDEAARRFALGLSPRAGAALRDHLRALGFDQQLLLTAGLLVQGESGEARDMFRGRLMFPIRDAEGRVVGFGGRTLEAEAQPKYLNTPRSPVFDKGHLLYALDAAREAIKKADRAVIVEGYMDAIAAHEHGYANVVASMGTALTEHQVGLLRKLAHHFVLALDPDVAGQEATLRSLESSWRVFEQRMAARHQDLALYQRSQAAGTLSVALLPEGRDPDQLIRDDPPAWERLIADATPLLDYLMATLARKFDLSSSQGKADAAARLLPLIAGLENPFEQDRAFRRLAELLGVSPETLEASIGKPWVRRRQRQPAPAASPFTRAQMDPLEEHTLALLLQNPDLREQAGDLEEDHFLRPENRAVFLLWRETDKPDMITVQSDDDLKGHLDHLRTREIPPTDRRQRAADLLACIRRLEERRLREMKAQEELLLAQGAESVEPDQMQRLQEHIIGINERLRRLFAEAGGGKSPGGR